jgi:hypothetical protein
MMALNPAQLWWVAELHLKSFVPHRTQSSNLFHSSRQVASDGHPTRSYNGVNGHKIATALAAMSHFANPLATPSQLYQRASASSSVPRDLTEAVFVATQGLTQAAGRLLQLPQSVTAQANVLLARYWVVDSPMAHEFSVGDISGG